MSWIKLVDYEGDDLYRGGFIRVNGYFPYEKKWNLCFMKLGKLIDLMA